MTLKIINIAILIFLLSAMNSNAQDAPLGLVIKSDGETTKLKIIPKTAYHWLQGIDRGYQLYRREPGQSDFELIHTDVIKPYKKEDWIAVEKGQEMYEFHTGSVEKIRSLLDGSGAFLNSFQQLQRADDNFKMYILITMRDKVFGNYVGLEFVDESAQLGKLYEYKVRIANSEFESTTELFNGWTDELKSPRLIALSKDKKVELSWIHDENLPILAYYLERSGTGLNYERLTSAPIWPTNEMLDDTLDIRSVFEVAYTDSLASNYTPYFYRLVALDAWGDEWKASASVQEMGKDQTGPTMGKVNVRIDSINRNFIINWGASPEQDVQSYFITQSFKTNGKDSVIIQNISPYDELAYTIENPIEMKNYYFKVGSIDTSGNFSLSQPVGVFINDISPPVIESDISFEVDSLGVVKLSWIKMKDANPMGYWVFKSFKRDVAFMKITDTVIHTNVLVDSNSLSLLNHEVHYYIVALDQSYNISKPSDVISVVLPDTIPPSVTYINGVSHQNDLVTLDWEENQSEDVASYRLFKSIPGKDWKLLGKVSATTFDFTYEETFSGVITYKVVAVDERGNIPVYESNYRYDKSKSVRDDMKLSIDVSDEEVVLSWKDTGSRYKLYKSEGQGYELLEYLDSNRIQFSTKEVEDGHRFYVKAYNEKGRLITISETVQL